MASAHRVGMNTTSARRKRVIASAYDLITEIETHLLLAQDLQEAPAADTAALILRTPDNEPADTDPWAEEDEDSPLWLIEGLEGRDGTFTAIEDMPDLDAHLTGGREHKLAQVTRDALVDSGVATEIGTGVLRVSYDFVRRLAGKAEPAGAVSLFGRRENLADYGWKVPAAA